MATSTALSLDVEIQKIKTMATLISTATARPLPATFFDTCEFAFRLMKEGKETEARKLYPLEYYLVKKYLYLNLDVFKKQMANKLSL